MGRIVVSAEIPAPAEKVWNYCKDIEQTPDWFPAIVAVRSLSEQKEGVGAEYEFTARNARRTVTYRMKVTEWEDGRKIRQEVVPGSGKGLWSGLLESMTLVWEYGPSNGGTRLTATQEMRLKGLADLLTQPWLLVFDRQLYKRAFERLARIMKEDR
ncbi:MAG: SRPBCC family protein [Chloroflexi bacterium]|nr:SRPBCC family protein [Chloroflexota bacterium]